MLIQLTYPPPRPDRDDSKITIARHRFAAGVDRIDLRAQQLSESTASGIATGDANIYRTAPPDPTSSKPDACWD